MENFSQAVLQQLGIKPGSFSFSSRYATVETATMQGSNGEPVVFLRRRFVPQADKFSLLQEHRLKEGERLDNITAQYYGDPERFWQCCDANNVLDPGELTEEPGSIIKITLPEGIAGNTNA